MPSIDVRMILNTKCNNNNRTTKDNNNDDDHDDYDMKINNKNNKNQ